MPDVRPPVRWLPSLLAGVGLLTAGGTFALVFLVRGSGPFTVDEAWNSFLYEAPEHLIAFSHAMNVIGGGTFGTWILPALIPLVLLALRRPWAAAFFLLASALSAGLVQLIKSGVARERPTDILVHSDFGSFPSGHTANAATMAVAFMILWPRLWVIIAGVVWTLLMAFSRTVLHAHWLSDTIGGALLGAGAACLLAAAFAVPLARERERRRSLG